VWEELRDCVPLSGEEYLEFAAVRDAEGALDFVARHGPLDWIGNLVLENGGQHVESFLAEARLMNEILEAVRSGPPRLSDELLDRLSMRASASNLRSLIWDPVAKKLAWQFETHCLIHALWGQLAQAGTRGDHLRMCEYCGAWFKVGTGGSRRADAKFCSDEHRAAFNNRARSRRP